jgi:hypothetical protein
MSLSVCEWCDRLVYSCECDSKEELTEEEAYRVLTGVKHVREGKIYSTEEMLERITNNEQNEVDVSEMPEE